MDVRLKIKALCVPAGRRMAGALKGPRGWGMESQVVALTGRQPRGISVSFIQGETPALLSSIFGVHPCRLSGITLPTKGERSGPGKLHPSGPPRLWGKDVGFGAAVAMWQLHFSSRTGWEMALESLGSSYLNGATRDKLNSEPMQCHV